MTLEKLIDLGRRIVREAGGEFDDLEVFLLRHDRWNYAVRDEEIRPELRVGRVQVGMRALRGGRLHLASTTSLELGDNVAALQAAGAVGSPTTLEGFAAASSGIQGRVDPSLETFLADPASVQEIASSLRDRYFRAPGRERIGAFEADVGLQVRHRCVVTSRGEGGATRAALSASADLDATHSDAVFRPRADAEAIEAMAGLGERLLAEFPHADVSPEELGVKGSHVKAVIKPRLAEGIFRIVLQEKLLASTKVSGNTRLEPGMRLFGPGIGLESMGDDPELVVGGPCDDEGTPAGRTRVIEEGVFRSFLSSRDSARRAGVPETGNGVRTPLFDEAPNEALIRDRLIGLELPAGTRSAAGLIASMERGVVLFSLLGIHGCDKARAAFSASARGGFAVRDGKVIGRLAAGRWGIAGRLLESAEGPSMFAEAEASRERELTGTGRVPWLLAGVDVG